MRAQNVRNTSKVTRINKIKMSTAQRLASASRIHIAGADLKRDSNEGNKFETLKVKMWSNSH